MEVEEEEEFVHMEIWRKSCRKRQLNKEGWSFIRATCRQEFHCICMIWNVSVKSVFQQRSPNWPATLKSFDCICCIDCVNSAWEQKWLWLPVVLSNCSVFFNSYESKINKNKPKTNRMQLSVQLFFGLSAAWKMYSEFSPSRKSPCALHILPTNTSITVQQLG